MERSEAKPKQHTPARANNMKAEKARRAPT